MLHLLLICTYVLASLSHEHKDALRRIFNCGFHPTSIIDVGAHEGEWTKSAKVIFPHSRFIMIEGDPRHTAKLATVGFPYIISLVSDVEKSVTFYSTGNLTHHGEENSLFKGNLNSFNNNVRDTAHSLDSLLEKKQLTGSFQLLRLDIQGAEMDALKGSEQTLKTVEAIVTEMAVMNYYPGSPSFYEYFSYLDSIGFALYAVLENIYDSNRVLTQIGALFIRKTSQLWDSKCTGYSIPPSFQTVKPK